MNRYSKLNIKQNKIVKYIVLVLFFAIGFPVQAQQNNALSLYETGMAHSSRGEFREAVHYFRKSLEKNPEYISSHYGAAIAYFSLGDWKRSIQHYKKVIEFDSKNISAHTGIALVYIQVAQFAQARNHLDYVKKKDPGNVDNNHAFGIYFYHLKQYSIAQSYFQKTIRLSPRHIQSLIGLAKVQLIKGRFNESKRLLDKAAAINPDHFEIHLLNGELLLQQALTSNDKAMQESLFEKALSRFLAAEKLQPENLNVQLQLVSIALYSNKIAEAYSRSKNLLKLKKNSNRILYLNAALAVKSEDRASAIISLQRALYRNPGDSVVRYKLESLLLSSPSGHVANKNKLAKYHKQRAIYYYKSRYYDLFRIHLDRALELNASCLPCLKLILNHSRKVSDTHSYIKVLRRLQRADSSDPRLKFRLERALKKTRTGLAYRNSLFNQKERPGSATYKRTSALIHIFDPQTNTALNYHVDVPAVVADALTRVLHRPGNIKSSSFIFRNALEKRIGASIETQVKLPFFRPYRPEYLRQIEYLENKDSINIEYILNGFVQSDKNNISYTATIIEKQTATVLAENTIRKRGRDAITSLISDLGIWIQRVLPLKGQIIKINNSDVYINIGSQDSVKIKDRFIVHRFDDKKGELEIVEVDSFVSRAKMIKGKVGVLDAEDIVVKIKKPN